jgi:prepilin-type N-terminal cleavage/methylation domain-containing protein
VRDRRLDDRGFTLTEVLVAMLILMSGAMAAAGLFTVAAASARTARVETQTTVLAAAKMEQLQSLAWGYDDGGAPVSDMSTDLSVEPATNGGPGLRVSPVDALDRNCPGYVDYLDAGGRWVGSGPVPLPEASYLRRWSIQPLAQYPNEVLVMRVLVTTVARGASRITEADAKSGPDALLVTIRLREAR